VRHRELDAAKAACPTWHDDVDTALSTCSLPEYDDNASEAVPVASPIEVFVAKAAKHSASDSRFPVSFEQSAVKNFEAIERTD
jgi:hypothetical protein